jgi:tetratricopeptide (TPR) repeat protein
VNQQVAEAFKKLYFGKRTGVLSCEGATARRAVYFSSGFVVGAKSSRVEDRLGEVMMRHGRINRQQFDDASHFIKSGWRLGEILAELNVIGEEEIPTFVRLQLLDIACTPILSPPKRLAFSPLSGVDAFLEAPLSVADILVEAARRADVSDEEIRALKDDPRRLGFPKDPLKRFQDVSLRPEEAFVLSRVDGTQTAREIFSLSPLSEEMTARTLLGLVQAELIEPEGELAPKDAGDEPGAAAAPRPSEADRDRDRIEVERLFQEFQFRDHWQVLEVERSATVSAIRAAFLSGAKRFHPDRFRHITDPSFQERLSFVFRRIEEAHNTLTSSARSSYEKLKEREAEYEASKRQSRPRAADAGKPRPMDLAAASSLLKDAEDAYRRSDFWRTVSLCQKAVDLAPGSPPAYHLLGLALSRNPKWRQDAEKNLRIATELDPWKVEYFVALGTLYRDSGLHLRARRAFEQAKVIDPALDVPEV